MGFEALDRACVLDGDELRHALTALARDSGNQDEAAQRRAQPDQIRVQRNPRSYQDAHGKRPAHRHRRGARALRASGCDHPGHLRSGDQAFLLRAKPDRRRTPLGDRHRRIRPRASGAGIGYRSSVPAPAQADALGREHCRIHSLHALGSGSEGRPRHALARRMRAPFQAGHHDPHLAAGSAPYLGR